MLIGLIDGGKTSGNLGNRLLAVAHLAARLSELTRNGILDARIIVINLTINRLIHLVNFILSAFILFVDFLIN